MSEEKRLDFDDWTKQVTDRLNALAEMVIFLDKEIQNIKTWFRELEGKRNE